MNQFQPSTEACDGCGVIPPVHVFIHSTRYRAINSRFCTDCILKQNHGTFCPICFELIDDSLLPNLRLMCVRCPSIAHRSCLLPSAANSAFLCPACADPNFSYLKLDRRVIDFQTAKVLVAASQISAISLSKAAVVARVAAERRAMEAAVARKKATEALGLLADVVDEANETSTEQEDYSGAQDSGLQSSE